MTLAPRWRKLLGDLKAAQGRVALMVAALAVGVFALTTIVSAYAVLTREISRNYLATSPASALIDVGSATPEVLAALGDDPNIAAVEAASIIEARVETTPGEWARMMLFVSPEIGRNAIGKVFPHQGEFPPKEGSILLEREALTFLDREVGASLTIELPNGSRSTLPVVGTVHDPSLAPSWQEQTGYGYLSAATFTGIGGGALELAEIVVRDAMFDQGRVDAVTARLAGMLIDSGTPVHEIQIPSTGQHPHQSQMTSVLSMFIAFAVLALILSAILTASMVSALLAQHVRQIAIMKAIGGTSHQIAFLYLAMLAGVAAVATTIGLPLGLLAGGGFADVIGQLLNLDIGSRDLPQWLLIGLAATGIAVPVLLVWRPIRRATGVTVREALADYGVSRETFGANPLQRLLGLVTGLDRTLALALRNAFRRRGRLVLNVALLGVAGAIFLASLDVELAWRQMLDRASAERRHDIEIGFLSAQPLPNVLMAVADVPGVIGVEPASVIQVAAGRSDGLVIVRTYPDGGHGSLSLRQRAPASANDAFIVGDDAGGAEGLVLNHSAWTLLGRPAQGSPVSLSIEGEISSWPLGGVLRQILTPATAYLQQEAFERASGNTGLVNAIRIVTADHDPVAVAAVGRDIEAALGRAGIRVTQVTTGATLEAAQAGHVEVLIVALLAIAIVMAAVGSIGLASSQGTSVTERIREFGIMRTIGASDGTIIRNIVAEGALIGVLSLPITLLIGLPLGYAIGLLVGTLSFGLSLPLAFSATALVIWTVILLAGSVGSSLIPALTATRITVRRALAHL